MDFINQEYLFSPIRCRPKICVSTTFIILRYTNFSKLMRTIHFIVCFECKTLTIFALRRMNNIDTVSEKLYRNTLRSFSNSHQHSYFQIKALAGLNQERELSSAFDKPLVNLCGKNQTYLCQAVCISTQSKPQTSVFQKRNRPKNNYLDCFIVMK